MTRHLSVCPSVSLSHAGILSKRLNISPNFFHHRQSNHSIFFYAKRYDKLTTCPRVLHVTGSPNAMITMFDQYQISLYLRNDTRQSHSYYSTPLGARMRHIKSCYFEWPSVILSGLVNYPTARSIARPLCDSWASCTLCEMIVQHYAVVGLLQKLSDCRWVSTTQRGVVSSKSAAQTDCCDSWHWQQLEPAQSIHSFADHSNSFVLRKTTPLSLSQVTWLHRYIFLADVSGFGLLPQSATSRRTV